MRSNAEPPAVVTRTIAVAAPAEVTFNTLTDPDRAPSWLPPYVAIEGWDPPTLRGNGDSYFLRLRPEDMTVEWSSPGTTAYDGQAMVRESGGGASEIEVLIHVPAPDADIAVAQVLTASLEGLREQVEENLDAG